MGGGGGAAEVVVGLRAGVLCRSRRMDPEAVEIATRVRERHKDAHRVQVVDELRPRTCARTCAGGTQRLCVRFQMQTVRQQLALPAPRHMYDHCWQAGSATLTGHQSASRAHRLAGW